MKIPERHDQKVYLEAAQWLVRLDDIERGTDANEQREWIAWLQRSPLHVQAYFDIVNVSQDVDELRADQRARIRELLTRHAAPAVSADGRRVLREDTRLRRSLFFAWSGRVAWVAGATAVICAAGVMGWIFIHRNTYATGIGEQAAYELADGSSMVLNTRSRACVSMTEHERVIDLEGEALFTVSHDARRPFFVHTHTATARAVGTKFNVYERQGGTTTVSVVQGIVQVSSGSSTVPPPLGSAEPVDRSSLGALAAPPDIVSVSAGEEAEVRRREVAKRIAPNVSAAIAWQHRSLVFEDASIEEVAAQFNRYNAVQFAIDPTAGRVRRVSGSFDPLHPEDFRAFLERDESLRVEQQGNSIKVGFH